MIKISRQQAMEYLETAHTEPTGERFRWSIGYRMIFVHEADGRTYEAHYRMGTGDEAERPWDYLDEVECFPVALVEKVVQTWERVE
jgi:hypothetical protein